MHTIGFTTVTFRNLSRRQICEIAVKNGIKSIEWGGDVHLPPGDLDACQEVISLQKEFGLKAASYGSYYRLGDDDDNLWKQVTDSATAIKADTIRVWQGNVSSNKVSPESYKKMILETQKIADVAAKKGLTVAFEFHQNTHNDCGDASVRFLKDVGKENVKTYWQPFGNEQDIPNLKAVLPWLTAVHVFYWEDYLRFPLKQGAEIWRHYLSVIQEANLSPNYIMEFVKDDDPQQFAEDVQVLKTWL